MTSIRRKLGTNFKKLEIKKPEKLKRENKNKNSQKPKDPQTCQRREHKIQREETFKAMKKILITQHSLKITESEINKDRSYVTTPNII